MVKFGWCMDELHDECVGSYTRMVDKVSDNKRGKPEQYEISGECPCECHA